MNKADIFRIREVIKRSIDVTGLKLNGLSVLTELGSNYFLFTPIIAAMAGAEKVYAWSRDSRYGKAEELKLQCQNITGILNTPDVIEFALNERPLEHIKEADIITNLGFVRPLDKNFLDHVQSKKSVITGMCEAWELRENDIDIKYCLKKGINVAGVWENHPKLKIFDACGPLAIKMSMEAGFEVYQNKIIVWSDDHFGDVISDAFLKFGACTVFKTTNPNEVYDRLSETDFLFICDYGESKPYFGNNSVLSIDILKNSNPGIGIVHLYGDVNAQFLQANNIRVFPEGNGRASVMTYTLAHLGPVPIISLHTAGLKVGEALKRGEKCELVQLIESV